MAEMIAGTTGALQGTVTGMVNKGQNIIDSILPPEKRAEIVQWITKFSTERPKLASFIASQIALTGFPLGLFIVITISIAIFALLAGIILGLLGAVLFIVTAVGFALIILLPTLFIAIAVATFIWLWGMAAYYILKKFNQKEIPGIHKPLKEGMLDEVRGSMEGIGIGGGEGSEEMRRKADREIEGGEEKKEVDESAKGEKKERSGVSGGAQKQLNGTANKAPNPKEAADVGKHAGKAKNVADGVTGNTGLT